MPHPTVIPIEAKSALNRVEGMPFRWSLNPYRGCGHGCVFCYARRTHTFLERTGLQDWQTVLYAKVNMPAVLRRELARRTWRHETVLIGSATDPYQPVEGRFRLMRGILSALADHATPARIITRSPLIVRDRDLLLRLARTAGVRIAVSVATLDEQLARRLEPGVAPPRQRLRVVRMLADAGLAVDVALAPVMPGLTDAPEHLRELVAAARTAGAVGLWHGTLHLGEVTRESVFDFLRAYAPALLSRYERLYSGRYAPRFYTDAVADRVAAEIASAPFHPPPTERPQRPKQLSLL
jgi:DNA repair photolyase